MEIADRRKKRRKRTWRQANGGANSWSTWGQLAFKWQCRRRWSLGSNQNGNIHHFFIFHACFEVQCVWGWTIGFLALCQWVMPLGARRGVRNIWFHIFWMCAPKASLVGSLGCWVGLVGSNSNGCSMNPLRTFYKLGWEARGGWTPNLVILGCNSLGNWILDLGQSLFLPNGSSSLDRLDRSLEITREVNLWILSVS